MLAICYVRIYIKKVKQTHKRTEQNKIITNNENELIDLDAIFDEIDQSAPTQEELEWTEIEKILDSPLTEQEREILEMEFDLD